MRTDGINYPDPVPVGYCAMCEEPIYWGDYVYETRNGELLHADGVYATYEERGNKGNTLQLTCAAAWLMDDLEKIVRDAGLEIKQW